MRSTANMINHYSKLYVAEFEHFSVFVLASSQLEVLFILKKQMQITDKPKIKRYNNGLICTTYGEIEWHD